VIDSERGCTANKLNYQRLVVVDILQCGPIDPIERMAGGSTTENRNNANKSPAMKLRQ
jgi:hypothetical protein